MAAAGFTGLALGVTLDVRRFYTVDMKVMTLVCLFCSVIAVASLMGLPAINVMVGTLAGIYIGRREFHIAESEKSVSKKIRNISLFTAIVTGTEAIPIGLLALNEVWVIERLRRVIGLEAGTAADRCGIVLVAASCVVLMAIQFWCTKTLAWIAFGRSRIESS